MAKGTRTKQTEDLISGSANIKHVKQNDILSVKKDELTGEFQKREQPSESNSTEELFPPEQVGDLQQQPAPETIVNIAEEKVNTTDKGIKPDEPQKEVMPIPTPGRFVTFFPHTSDQLHGSGKSWPALVTEADKDGNLSLQVFGKYTIGPRFTIPHKDNKQKGSELGHWEWPARS